MRTLRVEFSLEMNSERLLNKLELATRAYLVMCLLASRNFFLTVCHKSLVGTKDSEMTHSFRTH